MINEFLRLAEQAHPAEACALVLGSGRVYPCRNIAKDPSAGFFVDPVDQAAAEQVGKVVGIFHSHPNETAVPSWVDRAMCERTGVPWHIASWPNGEYSVTEPCGWKAPYEGRPFCWGLFDCFSIAQDWLEREKGFHLPRAPAEPDFWKSGRDWFADWIKAAPLVPVDGDLEPGDLIFMMCQSTVINHVAVYIGDSRILHQLNSQPSQVSIYGGHWQRCTVKIMRPRS